MSATAKLKYLRISPRKVRLVADMIRGQKVDRAKSYLRFNTNKSSTPLLKLLDSSVANAKNKMNWEESNLFISSIIVDEGPKLKRWRARARGSAAPIQKKTSHITISLDELKKTIDKNKKESKKTKTSKKESEVKAKKVSSLSEIKEDFSKDSKDKSDDKKSKTGKIDKKQVSEINKQSKPKIFRRKSI